MGLGPGVYGDWSPISAPDGLIRIPDVWLLRCGIPPGSTRWDFDDQEPGRAPRPEGWQSFPGEVIEPSLGTLTAPHAVRIAADNTTSTWSMWFRLEGDYRSQLAYYAGLFVGLPEPTPEPVVIRLVGKQFDGTIIDIDEVTLGPAPSPANACLMVSDSRHTIAGLRVDAYTADGSAVNLDIDSIFFNREEPYPLSPEVETASIRFLFPADGARISTARSTALVGEVIWPVPLPMWGVDIAYPNWDRSRVIIQRARTSYPWRLSEDGLSYRTLFWLDGVNVPPGETDFTASITGERMAGSASRRLVGVGDPNPPIDEYRSLVQTEVDIVPWAMEVTQAVRGTLDVQPPGSRRLDDFPLVQNKRTVVRGYATQQFPLGIPGDVRVRPLEVAARLYGFRDGATLAGSPLTPENGTVELMGYSPGDEGEAALRPRAGSTFNFVLPNTWTTGDVTLRFEVNPVADPAHVEELPLTGGWFNSITRRVTFTDTGRVNAAPMLVDYYWQCSETHIERDIEGCRGMSVGDQVSRVETRESAMASIRDWWRTLPASSDFPWAVMWSQVQISQRGDPVSLPGPRIQGALAGVDYGDIRDAFWHLEDCEVGTRIRMPDTRTFGFFLTPWGSPFVGGCAIRGGHFVFQTSPNWATIAQEAGHTAGMKHSSNAHDESSGGSALVRWSGDHGQLGPPDEQTWGFDTYSMAVITGGSHVHDYMSYGGWPKWTALSTWEHMFEALRRNRPLGDGRAEASRFGASEESEERLIVPGIRRADGTVELGEPYLGQGEGDIYRGDDLTVELRGAGDAVMASVGVALLETGTHSETENRYFIAELPPDVVGTALRVSEDGREVGGAPGSTQAPEQPDILTRTVGGGRLGVSWSGGEGLSYLVEVSLDGVSWWRLARTETPELELDPELLPFEGPGWQIRVQATDGVNVAVGVLEGVDFGVRPPVALIGDPLDGDLITPQIYRAQAVRTGLGEADPSFSWSLNGEPLAEGQEAFLPLLIPGRHVIGLTVETDGGSDSTEVAVEVIVDDDGDGMDDQWEEANGLDPADPSDGGDDPDGDGLLSVYEQRHGTDPHNVDTDGDNYADSVELQGGGNPLDPSSVPGYLHGAPGGSPPPRISNASTATEAAPPVEPAESRQLPPWAWALAGIGLIGIGAAAGTFIKARSKQPGPPSSEDG